MPSAVVQAARALVKRTRRGLYAGKTVRSGNSVSEDGGNRNRRVWKPNAQNKALYSEALDRMVRLRVTTAALRNMDKVGGLDEYLLRTPDHKLGSDVGLQLRQHIQAALHARAAAASGESTAAASPASPEPAAEAEAGMEGSDAQRSVEPSSSGKGPPAGGGEAAQAEAPEGLWAPGRHGAVGRSRLVVMPEHQVPRWDGSMKTVPQRSLRKPRWLLRS